MADYSKLGSLKELDGALNDIYSKCADKQKAMERDVTKVQTLAEPSNLARLSLRCVNVGGNPLDRVLLSVVRALKQKVGSL